MAGGSMFSDEGGIGGLMMGMGDMTGINMSGIPFIGGMFPDPNQKAMRDALQNASNMMGAQRSQSAAAYQNAANNMLGALQPAQNALSMMYGGGGGTPTGGFDMSQFGPPQGAQMVPQYRGIDRALAGASNDLSASFPGGSGGGGMLGGLFGGGNGSGGLGGLLGGLLGGPSGGGGGGMGGGLGGLLGGLF